MLKVAKEKREVAGGGGPGLLSIPPILRRILFIKENMRSHDKKINLGEKERRCTLFGLRTMNRVRQNKE